MTAPSRNSIGYQQLLAAVETANPAGTIMVITDNLSSHTSASTRAWLADHPRIQHAFIPKGACWLNLQEGWWRLFRREAFAGQSFATPDEIALATRVATCQLNATPAPGCGAAHHHPHATDATPLPTGSQERSTSRQQLFQLGEANDAADGTSSCRTSSGRRRASGVIGRSGGLCPA